MYKIVFLGTHGQQNIGDELLLETFLHQLGTRNHYTINTYDKLYTTGQLADRYSYDLINTQGDRIKLVQAILDSDVVIFGGGSIIKELYESTGRNRYSTLLMILAVVTFAKTIARKPVAMLNIGVGPIFTKKAQILTKMIVSQTDYISVRDEGSYQTCMDAGIPARKVHKTNDIVWSLTEDHIYDHKLTEAELNNDKEEVNIALNLNYHIANPSAWDNFLNTLADGFKKLNNEQKINIYLLPMQSGFKSHHDAEVLDQFKSLIPEITTIETQLESFEDVSTLIKRCDLLVSERLHAIIMASILGTPCFALAYDVKVQELAKTLDIEDYCLDINSDFEVKDFTDPMQKLIANLEIEKTRTTEKVKQLHSQTLQRLQEAKYWLESTRL